MKVKYLVLLLWSLATVGTLCANSAFSFSGFPNQDSNIDMLGAGMGETGLGDVYRKNTSFINPSLMTTLNQVYFSTGISLGSFGYYDSSGGSSRTQGLYFPYFNLTVPIKKHYLGFDYAPLYSGNEDVYHIDNELEIDGEKLTYDEINRVKSFIYKGAFLYAYTNNIINVGFSFNYYLGQRTQGWQQKFENGSGLVGNRYEINESFKAPGFTIGVNKRVKNIAFGAAYSSPTSLRGRAEMVTTSGSVLDMEDKDFAIPERIGVGTSIRLANRYKLNFDGHYERWSNNDYYEDPDDTYKIAFGMAYNPSWNQGTWLKNIPFRVGAYYHTLPFKANDASLAETAVTFGFSLPLDTPNSQLDFAVKYYQRGDTKENLYKDEGLFFGIGLSGFDFFKNRPKKISDREIPKAEYESFR